MSPWQVLYHTAQEDRYSSFDVYLGSWVLSIGVQSNSPRQLPQCRTQQRSSQGRTQLRRGAKSYQWTQLVRRHLRLRSSWRLAVVNKSNAVNLATTTYYCPGWNIKRDGRFILRISIFDPSCPSTVVKEVTRVLNLCEGKGVTHRHSISEEEHVNSHLSFQ